MPAAEFKDPSSVENGNTPALRSETMRQVLAGIGPQCPRDDEFKRRARLHQSRFRLNQLGVPYFREYGSRLPTAEALAGRNFFPWPGMLDAVAARFCIADKKLYWDMLASDHIPFNFFVPLRGHPAALRLVSSWLAFEVSDVLDIQIEWAPRPKALFLDDNTSFDAYIRYRAQDGSLGAIGIETKYTETAYAWASKERARMFAPTSKYHIVHEGSRLYTADSLDRLRTPRLKQFWRNQLLGEAMLRRPELGLTRFTSVLLYPSHNKHFAAAAHDYQQVLATSGKDRFLSLTYEAFLAQCRAYATRPEDAAWTDYLTQRYIVA